MSDDNRTTVEKLRSFEVDLIADNKRKDAEIANLRAALYEVVTNGQWTAGEQRGDWQISKDVYETARDALDEQLATETQG